MKAVAEPAAALQAPGRPAAEAAVRVTTGGTMARLAAVSGLLLIPCSWQSRIQAGDLSSHLYNSWLATLIREGRAEGLVVVPQWTNTLFDLILAGLLPVVGIAAAQRIAVSLCVLTFAWGAFALASAVARRPAWRIVPYIAVLAYGWVFHQGLFNFYLSTGLCCWALALLWSERPGAVLAAIPLLGLGYVAHALPVAWAAGCGAYTWLARRLRPRHRPALALTGVAALFALRWFFMSRFPNRWSLAQAVGALGTDQTILFGRKYFVVAIALLFLWCVLLLRLLDRRGALRTVLGLPFQLCVLVSAAIVLMPAAVMLPGFNHALDFINDRMSLAAGVTFCAFLTPLPLMRWERRVMAGLLSLYFAFLYVDQRAQNRIEDAMEQAVAQLPPASRVISGLCDPESRIHPVAHHLDRVCIGRCWSWGNYEPASGAFRVRVTGPNPAVVTDSIAAEEIEEGKYVVKDTDPPLYQIFLRDGRLDVRLLKGGDSAARTCFAVTPGIRTLATLAHSASK